LISEARKKNRKGFLDANKWCLLISCSKNFPNIEQVKELFRRLDFDNDGFVTKAEMAENSQKFTHQVRE
jgi:hypothetical protein